MVRVLIYCGDYPEYLRMTYVRGEIYDEGEIDEDLLSITHWGKKLHSLGYRNHSGFGVSLMMSGQKMDFITSVMIVMLLS
jgi:hypothetical protein